MMRCGDVRSVWYGVGERWRGRNSGVVEGIGELRSFVYTDEVNQDRPLLEESQLWCVKGVKMLENGPGDMEGS
jgi:hypothetical protein